MPDWALLVLIAIPVIVTVALVIILVTTARMRSRIARVPDGWIKVRGVVVDEQVWRTRRFRSTGEGLRAVVRQPRITFTTADGTEITFVSLIYSTTMPRPGALVAVYHHPRDPTRARIAPESLPRVDPPISTGLLVWGVLLIGMALVGFVFTGVVLFNV